MNGEVVGVNSQIATSTGDYNGIGFALPANEAANVYRQIRKTEKFGAVISASISIR
jgi:serine protease Do